MDTRDLPAADAEPVEGEFELQTPETEPAESVPDPKPVRPKRAAALKPETSQRKLAMLTVVWSTFVTLIAFAGPKWITLACEIATDDRTHLYRADQMDGIAVFLGVLMVLAWLAALVIPLIWLTRRCRAWRKWLAYLPAPGALLSFLISLYSFGLQDFLAALVSLK